MDTVLSRNVFSAFQAFFSLRLCNVAARVRSSQKSMQKAHNLALRLFNLCIYDIAVIS
jgi:hypothetical protein